MFRKTIYAFLFFILSYSLLFARQYDIVSAVERQGHLLEKRIQHEQALIQKWAAFQISSEQRKYDVTYYGLNLNIDPTRQSLDGFVAIHFNCLASLTQLELDLFSNFKVDKILLKNQELTYTRNGNKLFVNLPRTFQKDNSGEIQVYYRGKPVLHVQGGAFYFQTHGDNQPIICTTCELEGASTWWPCKDYPGDKPDSADINITVPADLVVATNGLLRKVTAHLNQKTYYWHVSYPIVMYNIALNISNYTHFTDVLALNNGETLLLDYYVYPENLELAQKQFRQVKDVVGFFSEKFCPYPFSKEKYGLAEVYYWGMEHQTMIAYGNNYRNNTDIYPWDYIILHETAHEWFGNLISLKEWGHFWMNEAFATYAEPLFIEHKHGRESYFQYMDYLKSRISTSREKTAPLFCTDSTNAIASYSGNIYFKGAWVLHTLRHVLGDKMFDQVIQSYCADKRYRYKYVDSYDFINLCEAVTGRELSWFFQQWVFGTGRPDYEFKWKSVPEGQQYVINFTIKQNQTNQLFKMPIPLRLTTLKGDSSFTIWDSLAVQNFTIKTQSKPVDLQFDPENWILKYLKVVSAVETSQNKLLTYQLYPNYPNPFNSATTIRFDLPEPGEVKVKIYNLIGQEVIVLLNEALLAGQHTITWDGRRQNSEVMGTGVYWLRMETAKFTQMRKMLLVK
ncbi:T9SS type A sorting domain-containing protein [candidate division KSB1 bacterium]|nr:T9SS type A sorting domain-containing protein [candidate division KSB1 bacterium]